ncbi:MAG TPA: MOSC N-terminal beta barrel domain-containing protein [Gemmatimonadaceae bacterium]|nr:MOSC N-terminal beta barrel domain-containing protein [Gemmatimonadaceae bacterium]
MVEVAALYVYPIKSCAGMSVSSVELDRRGVIGDRRFMVVDDAGRFLTQRELPRLALIVPRIADGMVTLAAPGSRAITVPILEEGPRRSVVVWRDTCDALDQGDDASRWLSAHLGLPCRLVRLADGWKRLVDPTYATRPDDEVSFADAYPLLLIGEASLEDLNTRLGTPLPMNRFRPNVVVRGSAPFAEDDWRDIVIGDVRATVVKPCARCVTTLVDQETGARGKEPLRTLATYRRRGDGEVYFGQNVIHAGRGAITVGDRVVV